MTYRVVLLSLADQQFRRLPPLTKQNVKAGLRVLGINPQLGKALSGEFAGWWRFRAHRYRIIYRIAQDRSLVEVGVIAHRRDVYQIAADAIRLMERRARYRTTLRPERKRAPS